MKNINTNISYNENQFHHSKATETYIDTIFKYDDIEVSYRIPIVYRRTGLDLKKTTEIEEYLLQIYDLLNPNLYDDWVISQEKYWEEEKPKASTTKEVFDILKSTNWTCVSHNINNDNWARRFQDLKEFGYTFATQTHKFCEQCNKNRTFVQCIPLPRYHTTGSLGYETWTPKLRKKIISVLNSYDVVEGKQSQHLLPDHKFPEIRWDENTAEENLDNMTDLEIKNKFQLMTNQRNQQKREVCRTCFQTNKRGKPFNINYYYEGEEEWNQEIPKIGKEAEVGCVGCGWYDMEEWRKSIELEIKKTTI